MQTFLPYSSFEQSAKCLDNRRLGKQRVECLQILNALADPNYGWQNHPAVKMWRGFNKALAEYGDFICYEWISRGFKDTCREKLSGYELPSILQAYPLWLNNESFHAAHRSNLLRKDPVHYGQFGWTELNNLPYVWPVK